ncbi:Kef-type potassium/proton antiporter (CPA2 family) [Litorimonas taeanensis]|uniref:Kef-type potassium/proton antiporter (CPA2 family) n=1 Tax=Litorimonas taeanensis TaxID=568099 RepID=A0A420WMI7_9PROT|nr:monovalent cation:proton antiporter-2 (CPA2) family protein [Litorimonas taeanensis]RKQ72200.1 Kef-type potassium/proton antiporter (CPA2 family) [Litorimonas taeanensis]
MEGSLLFSVFIFLAAACVLVPLSKLSGLGSVIGYLIAGVIIGPYVLGAISDPITILHFSEFGVVMMLFLIGLELKPKELWNMRSRLLGLGGLQVGASSLIIALVAHYGFNHPLGEAITIGMALALSSTAIALQIMQDRGMMNEVAGQSGFSVLLFQDVIVIAMIAALPFLATMTGYGAVIDSAHAEDVHGPEGLWWALSIFGVFAGMIIAGRILLRPIFKIIARSKVRETFTAMALLLVIGAALLMNWLGLSAALGAFIAGVVLADSEYRHQLERDIEPFKALLLGLFFISVGMSLDFATLAEKPALIFGLVAGLIGVKFLVLYVIGAVFKLVLSSRILFATLLCQAGEFGFVLFQFALTEGAISAETSTLLTAVIALSMGLTPILILIFDKFISPLFATQSLTGEPPIDEGSRVLVLGFGRVGQLAGRLLHTQNIATTIIDNDGDHIDFLKQFGHRVYYGDASDVDLLHKAGAAKADVIIVAMDDRDKVTQTVHEIREHFPKAKIVARARNRGHLFDLLAEDVDFAERETVRGGLAMGRKALTYLGFSEDKARDLSDKFLEMDFKLAMEAYEMRGDMEALVSKARRGHALLKETLSGEANYMSHDEEEDDNN